MTTSYDHLYLSPHFDDAALSCGGQIARHTAAGQRVLIVTITGGDPPPEPASDTVRALHERWADSLTTEGVGAVKAMVAQRRAEDRAAAAVLGADTLHLSFLDCIYRCGPDGASHYPGPTDMFGSPAAADAATEDALAETFAALPPAGRVYLPLGVGGHVDHLATRRAAGRVFAAPVYYEDYPYTAWPGALAAVLPPATRGRRTAGTVWLSAADLATKIAAVAAYASQLSSFFSGPDDLAAKLGDEGRRVMDAALAEGEVAPAWAAGAERLWHFTGYSFEETAAPRL